MVSFAMLYNSIVVCSYVLLKSKCKLKFWDLIVMAAVSVQYINHVYTWYIIIIYIVCRMENTNQVANGYLLS